MSSEEAIEYEEAIDYEAPIIAVMHQRQADPVWIDRGFGEY